MERINWEICFLCQVEKEEKLITPKNEGFESLERDLNSFREHGILPYGLNISWIHEGIADTLKKQNETYHKTCRTYCGATRLRRILNKSEESRDQTSPKSSGLVAQ